MKVMIAAKQESNENSATKFDTAGKRSENTRLLFQQK